MSLLGDPNTGLPGIVDEPTTNERYYLDVGGNFRKSIGLSILDKLAEICCKVTGALASTIRRVFPDSTVIDVLLIIISILCEMLPVMTDELRSSNDLSATTSLLKERAGDLRSVADRLDALPE